MLLATKDKSPYGGKDIFVPNFTRLSLKDRNAVHDYTGRYQEGKYDEGRREKEATLEAAKEVKSIEQKCLFGFHIQMAQQDVNRFAISAPLDRR